jgi:hypothetical protein
VNLSISVFSSFYSVVTAASGLDQVSYPNGEVKHVIYPLLDAKSENITQYFHQFYELV